jgi:hypothetical protein
MGRCGLSQNRRSVLAESGVVLRYGQFWAGTWRTANPGTRSHRPGDRTNGGALATNEVVVILD